MSSDITIWRWESHIHIITNISLKDKMYLFSANEKPPGEAVMSLMSVVRYNYLTADRAFLILE